MTGSSSCREIVELLKSHTSHIQQEEEENENGELVEPSFHLSIPCHELDNFKCGMNYELPPNGEDYGDGWMIKAS